MRGMKLRFSTRDLLWFTVVAALVFVWWLDHAKHITETLMLVPSVHPVIYEDGSAAFDPLDLPTSPVQVTRQRFLVRDLFWMGGAAALITAWALDRRRLRLAF